MVCSMSTSCSTCLLKSCFWIGYKNDTCTCVQNYNNSGAEFWWALKPGSRCQDFTGLYCGSTLTSTSERPEVPSSMTSAHFFWLIIGALLTFTVIFCCCLSMFLKHSERLRPVIQQVHAWISYIFERIIHGLTRVGTSTIYGIRRLVHLIRRSCSCWAQQEKPNDEFIDYGGNGNDHNLSESEELYDRLSTVNHRMVNVYEEIPGDSFSAPQPSSSSNSQQQQQEQQQQQQSQPSINVASNPSALIPVRTQPLRGAKINTSGFDKNKLFKK
ncbi:unnamed protein product [Allacma fusca]|uniref:Uncharacterized protein n=1 Tax=Allacma fusca TaxID=39272 RepID=A0A8J2KH54_9HEXA|nr:unnamed protein product [Allacma fusca]